MKEPKSNDRRVVRTRASLREALVSLILERGWDAIGIQDVCDRANVGRSTFYTHFADKEDLLLSGFDDLRRVLRVVVKAGGAEARSLAFTRALLEHAHENRRLFRALVGKRSSQTIQKQFLKVVVDLTDEGLAESLAPGTERDATVHYVSGAFFQLVVWWIDSRQPLGPVEVDAVFQRLTKPVLAAARARR